MAAPSFYPPSPANVPDDLTEISPAYRTRVVLLLGTVVAFFAAYFGLLFLSLLLILLPLWPLAVGAKPAWIVLAGLGSLLGLVIFVFLLKGFFKHAKNNSKSADIEVTPQEHPRLFRFIEEVCADTGADMPDRVFVSFEVNASAGYNPSLFSVLFSSKKNLKIGLGLVNILNLTEFKAVLAHEFGHFGQSSMRMGGYVYLAQKIIGDMIYGEDFFEEILSRWRRSDNGALQIPAYAITAVTWSMSQLFKGIFYGIFFLHKALSRQMEFHADLVAASVTGSDAIVHGLKRVVFGDSMMELACRLMAFAADHKLYSTDVFLHQNHAASFLRKQAKDPDLGDPPALPDDPARSNEVFNPDDEVNFPVMWADHPPNHMREDNVKLRYIRTTFDERSPWILFDNPAELRARATYKMYRLLFGVRKGAVFTEAEDVQAFIDEERAETTYDPRYHGLYDDRILEPGDVRDLATRAGKAPWDADQLIDAHASLFDEATKRRGRKYLRHVNELNYLREVRDGRVKLEAGEFKFRGQYYPRAQAREFLHMTEEKFAEDRTWLRLLDQKVFIVHYHMARWVDDATAKELLQRYVFHLGVQRVWNDIHGHYNVVTAAIQFLMRSEGPLDGGTFANVVETMRAAHQAMAGALAAAETLTLPKLKNVTAGAPLRPFLFGKRLVGNISSFDYAIRADWIDKFYKQFSEVHKKVVRIHFKSLGGILTLQERVAKQCLEQWAVPELVDDEAEKVAK